VVEHYNMMGPVKAALESSVRYMAAELGGKGIRVHALSPGAMATRAASGIDRFDELLARTAERAPTHHLVTVEDIGPCAAFLASDAAKQLTRATETVGQLGLRQRMGRAGHCWRAWPGYKGVNRSWSVPSRIRVRGCKSLSCPTVSVAL
jgi:hypothetical protein